MCRCSGSLLDLLLFPALLFARARDAREVSKKHSQNIEATPLMRIKASRSDIRVAPIYKPQTRPINPAGIESSGEPVNAWLTKHPPSVTYDVDLGTHALDPRSKRR